MSMTMEEIIKKYEVAVEGGKQIAPFMGEDVKEVYEMLKAGLSALRPVTREQVERVWRGEWIDCSNGWMCSRCEHDNTYAKPFCPNCGAPMTDKAVDMVMERMEALHSETKTD